ncbi:CRLS1-like protein [Mya arenaria]|uniref:CRLS1-like protein n=1 Tax=Mya arenaria TaxID=6604 RepID=A0ABY7FE32_MYAAR|nr:CRLS1-like protein [Mya arenaria]
MEMQSLEDLGTKTLKIMVYVLSGKEVDCSTIQMKENIYTIPNAITVTRMAVTPVIGYLIIQQSFSWALGIFIVAAISDSRNTFFQLSLLSLTMASPVFDFIDHPVIQALWYLTAITTVGTGVDYAINRNKYIKFPKQPPAK